MGTAISFVWLIGFIGAWVVLYHRVGFPDVDADWREFVLGNPTGFVPWAASTMVKAWLWPVTLMLWLARGQHPTHWKAFDRDQGGRPVRRVVYKGEGWHQLPR